MASLEKRYDGRYRIVFCWQGERRYHSLGKLPERDAHSCLDRLEESLRFVERGLLQRITFGKHTARRVETSPGCPGR